MDDSRASITTSTVPRFGLGLGLTTINLDPTVLSFPPDLAISDVSFRLRRPTRHRRALLASCHPPRTPHNASTYNDAFLSPRLYIRIDHVVAHTHFTMPRDVGGYTHELKPDISQQAQPVQQLPFNPYTFAGGHPGPSSQPFLYGNQAAPVGFHNPYPRFSLDEGADASTDRPPPLKRGDACLYCRKRRIRCSATKPSCHHCTKLRRECVYDVGKPVSRVRKLENKVAELESYLQAAQHAVAEANGRAAHAQAQARAAQSQLPVPSAPLGLQPGQNVVHDMPNGHINMAGNMPYPTPSSTAPPQDVSAGPGMATTVQPSTAYSYPPGTIDQSTVDITMLDNFQPAPGMRTMAPRVGQTVPVYAPQQPIHVPPVPGPMGQGMVSARAQPPPPPPPSLPQQQQQQQQQPKHGGFDWDTLDTDFMSLVNQMGETSTTMPPSQAQYQYGYQQSAQSAQTSNPQGQAHRQLPGQPGVQAQPPFPQIPSNQAVLHPLGNASSQEIHLPVSASDITGRVSGAFIQDADDEDDSPSLPAEWTDFDLVGGWYDPNDLPKQARAELWVVLMKIMLTKQTRCLLLQHADTLKQRIPCSSLHGHSRYGPEQTSSPMPPLRHVRSCCAVLAGSQTQETR